MPLPQSLGTLLGDVAPLGPAAVMIYVAMILRASTQGGGLLNARVTLTYVSCCFAVTALVAWGMLSPTQLSLDPHQLKQGAQPWAIGSCFLWSGDRFGPQFAAHLWLFTAFSSAVERNLFVGDHGRYTLTLVLTAAGALAGCLGLEIFGSGSPISLCQPLSFSVCYLWSRSVIKGSADGAASLGGYYWVVPWLMLGASAMLCSSVSTQHNLVGIVSAVVTELCLGLPGPQAQAATKAQTRTSVGSVGGSEGKTALDASSWPVQAVMVGVALGGGYYCWGVGAQAPVRATQSSALIRALDWESEVIQRYASNMLGGELGQRGGSLSVEAVLMVHQYTALSWMELAHQNAAYAPAPPFQAVQSVVEQVLQRSDVPPDVSDDQLVSQINEMVGKGHQVIRPQSMAVWHQALQSYRENRDVVKEAFAGLKTAVSSEQPVGDTEATLEMINTTLTEFDVPRSMTDAQVLDELLFMLGLEGEQIAPHHMQFLQHGVVLHRQSRRKRQKSKLQGGLTRLKSSISTLQQLSAQADTPMISRLPLQRTTGQLKATVREVMSTEELPMEGTNEEVLDHLIQLLGFELQDPTQQLIADKISSYRILLQRDADRQQAFADLVDIVQRERATRESLQPNPNKPADLQQVPGLVDLVLEGFDLSSAPSDENLLQELLKTMELPEVEDFELMTALLAGAQRHQQRHLLGLVDAVDEALEDEWVVWSESAETVLPLRLPFKEGSMGSFSASELLHLGGDANEFALFLSATLQCLGTATRLSVVCDEEEQCQLLAEAEVGSNEDLLRSTLQKTLEGLAGDKRPIHYKVGAEGKLWINLDWNDNSSVQLPGAPYPTHQLSTIYYPLPGVWHEPKEPLDSAGNAQPPQDTIRNMLVATESRLLNAHKPREPQIMNRLSRVER